MAGLGYRAFAAGEVLTASNLQGYAVDQSVMVFATAADRTTALPVPSEGMIAFLADDNRIEVYDGAAWKIVYLPPTDYTPTATNYTRTSGSFRYSVAGNMMSISGTLIVSAVSGSISFTIPAGFTMGSVQAGEAMGTCRMVVAGSTFYGVARQGSSTTVVLAVYNAGGTYVGETATSSTIPATWAASSNFSVSVQFPLA